MAKLKKTNNSVFIENIPRLEWGKGTDNSFVRSTQLALNALDENYSYNYLMGVSGAAFRLHFHKDWCPSSADSTTGYDVSGDLFRAVGYNAELLVIDDKNFDDIKKLFQVIKDYINKGIPLIAINLKVCPEWGVITGYTKDKPGILCRTYFDESDDYSLAEHAPWLTFHLIKKRKPMDIGIAFKKSLEIAAKHATTEKIEDYFSGFKAFEFWVEQLEKFVSTTREFKNPTVNQVIFNNLYDSRKTASAYLESMEANYKIPKELTSNYKKEVDLMDSIIKEINKEPVNHKPALINKQILILKKILDFENHSIQLIKKYLI